jgi:hypothetical protein
MAPRIPRLLLAAGLTASGVLHAARELDEVFPRKELVTGKVIDQTACAALQHAVWVAHKYGTECIRYYASSSVRGAKQAVFYFHGDRLDAAIPANSAYRDNSVRAQLSSAHRQAQRLGVPFVMVARPGAYGSSGKHSERRRPKEFHSLNAALDAIKARHGIESIVLAGHSGGAIAVAALLTLGRSDVSCVVGTSGDYAVIQHVGSIRPDPQRRIFVIGDPRDQQALFRQQRDFAERIGKAGHQVALVEAQGAGRTHHDLRQAALVASALCAKGVATERIIQAIAELGPGRKRGGLILSDK